MKAHALLIPAVASALACFLSKQMPQLEIQPWHKVTEGQGRARGAVVKHMFVMLRSIGWLGVLAVLLFQCFCTGLVYSKCSIKSMVPAVSGLV